MLPNSRHIDYNLPEPKDVLFYAQGEVPVVVRLETLVVYRDEMHIQSMSMEPKVLAKIKGHSQVIGSLSYKNLSPTLLEKMLDEDFCLLAEGFLVARCYAHSQALDFPSGKVEFVAAHLKQDPPAVQRRQEETRFENVGHTF